MIEESAVHTALAFWSFLKDCEFAKRSDVKSTNDGLSRNLEAETMKRNRRNARLYTRTAFLYKWLIK